MRRSRVVLMGTALLSVFAPAVVGGGAGVVQAAESCAVAEHAGGEWRKMGHDLANTFSQPLETAIGVAEAPSLAPEWTFSVASNDGRGGMTGTPVVADGCTFVATDGGHVYALNADTGAVVWHVQAPSGGGINSTLAVDDGRVFANVSRSGSPYTIALDQATGVLLWETTVDTQPGSDTYASPVVFDGLVFAGVSGAAAETSMDESERYAFQGAFVLLDAADGSVVKKTWAIHEPAADGIGDGYAGAAIWSTPAVDEEMGFAYVGAGNPFQPQKEHPHANAVLKIDLRPDSTTFGEIVGSYKGDVDEFFPALSELPCGDISGNPPPWYPQGVGACADIDLDFGASPNLFVAGGKKIVGDGQKSGVYHAFDADTMAGEWKAQLGPPGMVGGIVGSATVAGSSLVGPVTQGGYLWSVGSADGGLQWAAPTADGAHYAHQTSSANGVVYTMDLKGFLQAFDAASGTPLLHTPVGPVQSAAGGLGGGVAVARNTVYAPANGVLTAFRVGGGGGGGGLPEAPPTPEGVGPVVTTGPGGFALGYAPPVVAVRKGGSLTYVNADVAPHDVVTDDVYGPDDQPWCRNYPLNRCPLIWSNLISLGNSTPVLGLENVTPGATYAFTCSLHPNMRGTLVVSPA